MNIKDTITKVHATAVEKGFWDKEFNLGEKLMLITSELGEALEADRTGKSANIEEFDKYLAGNGEVIPSLESYIDQFKKHIKDSFSDELADATIRIFDLAGKMNIDLEYHIRHKMQYNSTRPKLHGKKY